MVRKVMSYSALAFGLLVAAAVAVQAFQSLQTPFESPKPSAAAPAVQCGPPPCANLQNYTLWVTNLNVGPDMVTMDITFQNASDSTHAAPEDLKLLDAANHAVSPLFDSPDCTRWSRHDFANGATYGPLTICFRQTGLTPPLVLRWSPDFGIACCQTDITLD